MRIFTLCLLIGAQLFMPKGAWARSIDSIEICVSQSDELVQAIDHDNDLVVQNWLKSGHSPVSRIKNKLRESLVDRAVAHASLKVFSVLVDAIHKQNLDAKLKDARGTPLILTLSSLAIPGTVNAAKYEKMIELVLRLNPLAAQAKDRAYVGDGRTALHQAAAFGNLKLMELLVSKGAEIEGKNSIGETPLHLAARFGHLDAVKYLVSKGALVNGKSKFTGTTALMAAAEMGHELVIRFLMISGAKRDVRDAFGKTAPQRFKEYTLVFNASSSKRRQIR